MIESYNALFLCTGNSARSIMAECLLNQRGAGRFKAYSAGSQPTGRVHPFAIETMKRMGCATDGLRSKSWDEFAQPGAPAMDFVFTVCDNAAGEACPLWPGKPVTAHWGVEDPAAFEGSEDAKLRKFHDVATTLHRRIELMLALPMQRLDAMALQREVKAIGRL